MLIDKPMVKIITKGKTTWTRTLKIYAPFGLNVEDNV